MSDIKDIDLSGPNQTGRLNDEIQILKAIRGVLELNSKVMEEFKTGKKNPALVRQLIVLQDFKNNW